MAFEAIRIRSDIAMTDPPAVFADPAARFNSPNVVVTMTVTGSPWCCPSSPDAKTIRPIASIASCTRCPWERSSASICSCVGVPLIRGSGSAGLHIPGAANFANNGSHTAKNSGVTLPDNADIPSDRCGPIRTWRLRARSASSGSGPS